MKRFFPPALMILASIVFVSANAPTHEQMSLFDEYVYIDYLEKFPEQGVIRQGEMTGELAREYYSCQGVEVFGKIAPENCATGDYSVDAQYPMEGTNSADIYTPLYFGVTWLIAQPIMWATGSDLVEAGRLAGAAWLAAAAVLLYFALGRLQLSVTVRVAAPLLMIASVGSWLANTYISTDASALPVGAALFLLALRYVQTGRGPWLLIAVSVLGVALKFQNLMAVASTCLFLLLAWASQRWRKPSLSEVASADQARPHLLRSSTVLVSVSMLLLSLLAQVAWMTVRASVSLGVREDPSAGSPLGLEELVRQSFKFFGKIMNGINVDPNAVVGWALSNAASWVLIAGVLAAVAIEARWSIRYNLAISWLFTIFTAGPALALATFASAGYFFDLPVRYGFSLVPVALAFAAALFDRKIEIRVAFVVLAGATFIFSLTPLYPGTEAFG